MNGNKLLLYNVSWKWQFSGFVLSYEWKQYKIFGFNRFIQSESNRETWVCQWYNLICRLLLMRWKIPPGHLIYGRTTSRKMGQKKWWLFLQLKMEKKNLLSIHENQITKSSCHGYQLLYISFVFQKLSYFTQCFGLSFKWNFLFSLHLQWLNSIITVFT